MIEAFINELAGRGYKDLHRATFVVIKQALDRAVYLDWLGISTLTRKKPMIPPRVQPVTSIPTGSRKGGRYGTPYRIGGILVAAFSPTLTA